MSYERIPLDRFGDSFSAAIELSSVALGGTVVSVSDEFFAEAYHLLLVEVYTPTVPDLNFADTHDKPAPSLKGQFGPKGALFSGWETRRHNPGHDWCIIKLGATGSVSGFDVDTAYFNGNEAPQVSIDALCSSDETPPQFDDPRWSEVLPKVDLGPNSRHLFAVSASEAVNYIKLNMYPDGGIARFRVYGLVSPVFPTNPTAVFDLAHVFSGGRVVFTSDQHFGVGSNLILPGRGEYNLSHLRIDLVNIVITPGKDMGDGWETKRSRSNGHKDWAIIKLGDAGLLSQVEIDTAHFKGNFPESCELHAVQSDSLIPSDVPRTAGPVSFPERSSVPILENVEGMPYTHVRITIYPDGGIKRVRVLGTRTASRPTSNSVSLTVLETVSSGVKGANGVSETSVKPALIQAPAGRTIPALPLTAEAFAPFGQVVQAYSDIHAVPSPAALASRGTAIKFHKLALLQSSYPSASGATAGLSVYRCQPVDVMHGGRWEVKLLERHPYTNQAFIPMGGAAGLGDALESPGTTYLVIVAKNGEDDKPDLATMRAFIASAGQGIVYDTAIWRNHFIHKHHPMAALYKAMDFTCVETQVGSGDKLDCEVVELDGSHGYNRVKLPDF
ncbi:putative allantoicase [Grifola frondosa]|uniref:Putative allantoicase n=1 Tax=Grifola frondosa TaxID=5627 RepID=A0A1C7LU14_GRIFR|nr:putative allantoicase [Grifola frondosa]